MTLRPAPCTLDAVQRSPRRGRTDPQHWEVATVATNTNGKRTTLADLMAAAALGAIDPTAEVITAEAAAIAIGDARRDATTAAAQAGAARTATTAPSGTEHECAIAGCRHGAAHGGPTQPDRQEKLACDTCGAVARMTTSAIMRAARMVGGIDATAGYPRCPDGGTYLPAARRTYTRRSA
jgi:hypothetical protein